MEPEARGNSMTLIDLLLLKLWYFINHEIFIFSIHFIFLSIALKYYLSLPLSIGILLSGEVSTSLALLIHIPTSCHLS